MTIKTLEDLVGMTRANIRFYEEQGFLAPARLENGYRDYSDADAEVLRKVKLFRRLHLDLDTIHKLQDGEMALAHALADQLAALERDQEALDRAREVCEELERAGEDWSTLDPVPWLHKLEAPPVPASPRFAPPRDIAPPPESTLYPWRRFFAREIDLMLCGLMWAAVSLLGLRWHPPTTQPFVLLYQMFNSYMGWGLLFLIEPVLLHLFGTTPGKLLFGISVRGADGGKLTWKQALRRTWEVFSRGYGWNVPGYSLWQLWKSYKACQDSTRGDWEGYLLRDQTFVWETYRVADDRAWRCVVCAGIYVLIPVLSVAIDLWSFLPPNRGELTEAEFYENCAFYAGYLDAGDVQMDEDGHLLLLPAFPWEYGLYGVAGEFSVTLTDGAVTGVAVTSEAETTTGLWLNDNCQQVAFLAFVGSFPEVGPLALQQAAQDMGEFISGADRSYTCGADFTSADLPDFTMRQVTRLEGFEESFGWSPMLSAERGRTARFWQEFTIAASP